MDAEKKGINAVNNLLEKTGQNEITRKQTDPNKATKKDVDNITEPIIKVGEEFRLEIRDPVILGKFKELLFKIDFRIETDEKKALADATIQQMDKKLHELFQQTTNIIVADIMGNAIDEEGNPLLEREINEAKKEMSYAVKNLTMTEIEEKYTYIHQFSYPKFKDEVLPLEEDFLLEYYHHQCANLMKVPANSNAIIEFSKEMLSGELQFLLEDIARF